ncbi:hypothetical protein, partial [Salmonella sp. s54925]|uniref:hypothetical protein n=1 Tax=Salmonella sp. s54925 TaxID=3159674 RepID=UPI0039816B36
VNVEDDEIPEDEKYNLDGNYVPRILFLDSSGNVDETIINENRSDKKSKYFYQYGIDVAAAMKLALEHQSQSSLERGFGSDIEWMTMDKALKEAVLSGKPIFLIIHQSWCGACLSLKAIFN